MLHALWLALLCQVIPELIAAGADALMPARAGLLTGKTPVDMARLVGCDACTSLLLRHTWLQLLPFQVRLRVVAFLPPSGVASCELLNSTWRQLVLAGRQLGVLASVPPPPAVAAKFTRPLLHGKARTPSGADTREYPLVASPESAAATAAATAAAAAALTASPSMSSCNSPSSASPPTSPVPPTSPLPPTPPLPLTLDRDDEGVTPGSSDRQSARASPPTSPRHGRDGALAAAASPPTSPRPAAMDITVAMDISDSAFERGATPNAGAGTSTPYAALRTPRGSSGLGLPPPTVVLDLDETLVHASVFPTRKDDFSFSFLFGGSTHTMYALSALHIALDHALHNAFGHALHTALGHHPLPPPSFATPCFATAVHCHVACPPHPHPHGGTSQVRAEAALSRAPSRHVAKRPVGGGHLHGECARVRRQAP